MASSALGNTINKMLDLCRAHPDGLPQRFVEEEITDVELLSQALNWLLSKQKLLMFKQGDNIVYKEQIFEVAVKFNGLATEDMLVYQSIEAAANQGIWTADLKKRTNLQHPQIIKALKNLEGRNLVKAVKTVTNKNRKVYMLFELTPSREVTGGPFYTGQDYDAEFVDVVKQQCLQFITRQELADLEAIADAIRRSGITQVELGLEEFKQIMDTLVLDGDVEETMRGAKVSSKTLCYRVAKSRIPEASALTNIPCGICPVLHECSPGGLISPETCVYFNEWLSF